MCRGSTSSFFFFFCLMAPLGLRKKHYSMVYVFVRIVFVVQGQTVVGSSRKDENSTPILCFLAVFMLQLPLFPQCRAHHLAASVWGDAETRFSKIQHDKFEKKIFFLKQLSQHWKQPEDLRPLTFNLAGIK